MADADELFGHLAEDLAPRGAKLSKMFGMPCLKDPNGKAFVGLHDGELVVRLHRDSPEHAEALAVTGAHLFDPMGGPVPLPMPLEQVIFTSKYLRGTVAACQL
ncbi:hypothetical protein OG762_02775 [Streptomyces sp. NBC_01136]|uniref:hypothetical protein n=1 Tax=Streptomyces sp. NBC_01136 TaxID=2903754 RepID=UPI003864A22D|nr:hypothetical protein OG762_02775 [Streptomyces sp. NBC_01136]